MSYQDVVRARQKARETNLSFGSTMRLLAAVTLNVFDQPDPARVLGLSCSHWSGVIDFQLAWERGVRFVWIKFVDGKSIVRFAEENYRGAIDAGMMVGGYGWLYKAAVVSPGGVARALLSFMADHPCQMGGCFDYEWTVSGNPDSGDLWGARQPYLAGYGRPPATYSASGYVAQYPIPVGMAGDPFYQAQYHQGLWDKVPPFYRYHWLQFSQTGDGAYFGYPRDGEKACELNYWYSDLASLYAFCSVAPVPDPAPAPGPVVVPPVQPPAAPPDPGLEVISRVEYFNQAASLSRYQMGDLLFSVLQLDLNHFRPVVGSGAARGLGVRTVGKMLEQAGPGFGVNGGGFHWLKHGRRYLLVCNGVLIANGVTLAQRPKGEAEESIYVDAGRQFSVGRIPHALGAVNYPNLLISHFADVSDAGQQDLAPRSGFGWFGMSAWVLSIDGLESSHTGGTRPQMAKLFKLIGAEFAVNLDGGFNAQTWCRLDGAAPFLLNVPSDANIPGRPANVIDGLLFLAE